MKQLFSSIDIGAGSPSRAAPGRAVSCPPAAGEQLRGAVGRLPGRTPGARPAAAGVGHPGGSERCLAVRTPDLTGHRPGTDGCGVHPAGLRGVRRGVLLDQDTQTDPARRLTRQLSPTTGRYRMCPNRSIDLPRAPIGQQVPDA